MISYDYFYRLNEIHFMSQLIRENENIERHIERLNKEIENMKKRQLQLYEKSKELLNMEYEYSVELWRYERDRITYELSYLKTVKGCKASTYHNTSERLEFYKFTGKERREAIKLAEQLAKKYNCKLNKNF